jgi:hypothetical protein
MSTAATVLRRWGTIEQAAAEHCVSINTIRRKMSRGEVYAERVSPRRLRVDLDSVRTRPAVKA